MKFECNFDVKPSSFIYSEGKSDHSERFKTNSNIFLSRFPHIAGNSYDFTFSDFETNSVDIE